MRRIRVLLDSEIFGQQVYGGVSRYFAALLAHLPRHGVAPRVYAPLTFNQYLRTWRTPGFIGVRAPLSLRNLRTRRLEARLGEAADVLASRLRRFDLLHRTLYGRRLPPDRPTVVTVYDMIPELFPEEFPRRNPHEGKRDACARASLIIAISEQTKRDVLALYPGLDCPIQVIHLGVDDSFCRARVHGQDDGTVLFVGRRSGYKNFATFAEATSRLLAERPELRVLCVGSGKLQPEELAPYVAHGVVDRVGHQIATDEELPALYRRARVFVFPSMYEGFGLPILEAFACGCPVVLAEASCFREVAAEAGEFFDPRSSDALLEKLRRVTRDAARRDELRRLGERRLTEFSWDRTAERTAAAYRRLLEMKA